MLSITENIRLSSIRKRKKRAKDILLFLIANALLLCNFAILYLASSKDMGHVHEIPQSDNEITVQLTSGEPLPDELVLESNGGETTNELLPDELVLESNGETTDEPLPDELVLESNGETTDDPEIEE